MCIKDRIMQLIDYKRMSILAFEKAVGVSNGYINSTKRYSAENCAKILTEFPEISSRWLLLGEGYMLRNPSQTTNNVAGRNVCGVNVNGRDIDIKCPSEHETLLSIVNANNETISRLQAQLDKAQSQIGELLAMLKTKK